MTFDIVMWTCYILVSTLVLAAQAEVEWPGQSFLDQVRPIMEKCSSTNPVDAGVLEKAKAGDLGDDPDLKKLLLCNFDMEGVIDHDTGEIFYYKLMDLLPNQETKRHVFELVRFCIGIHESSAQDTALKFAICLKDKGSPFFFI